jgi:hypothetical protein
MTVLDLALAHSMIALAIVSSIVMPDILVRSCRRRKRAQILDGAPAAGTEVVLHCPQAATTKRHSRNIILTRGSSVEYLTGRWPKFEIDNVY